MPCVVFDYLCPILPLTLYELIDFGCVLCVYMLIYIIRCEELISVTIIF